VTAALRVARAASAAGRRRIERFEGRLAAVLDHAVERRARVLVERVRRGGDAALAAAVAEHDGWTPGAAGLRLAPLPEDTGWTNLPAGFAAALDAAIAAVETYARRQLPAGFSIEVDGVALAELVTPLARVGLYVPGGRASYPSTAVMSVVPARVAGVAEIAVATPPRTYLEQPALRYALARLGVEEIWGMGGAHAVAALAYGTEAIRRVDLVAGPGSAWVTAAKRAVLGAVAIDGLMGPSEVVIVATEGADPDWIAADLLAQAEHDPRAAALLLTPSPELAHATAAAVERRLSGLATAETARAALAAYGAALVVAGVDEAIEIAQSLAPEHLQLVGADAERAALAVTHAGALFVGAATPEVFGDYLAGPSHVLPTCGTARFASALGVETFVRRSHRIEVRDSRAADRLGRQAEVLARVEGLPAHAASAALRALPTPEGAL
jgi:histidinol dehydrogenase